MFLFHLLTIIIWNPNDSGTSTLIIAIIILTYHSIHDRRRPDVSTRSNESNTSPPSLAYMWRSAR